MKTVMVIPSYWSRPSAEPWKPGDAIYDHPTALDQEGTLTRALESIRSLEDRDFTLVVLACSTAVDLEAEVEAHVQAVVRAADPPVETLVVSHSHLDAVQKALQGSEREALGSVLSLRGYSNVRNMCLFVPYVLGAEIAVLIDDDEYFDDPTFMRKAREFIGSRFMGKTIDGVAGYYVNAKGTYYDDVPEEIHWMSYWDRFGSKREAFDKIIPGEPRLKQTPFAFGGCMVIHRALFRTVPFDPRIPRGEDTDYVLNARMFGFNFFLDNKLSIQHRPPPKTHPTWQRLREDIFRLMYAKAKIDGQTEQINMTIVEAEDFDPYPGEFLRDTLEDKILITNLILALDYLSDGNVADTRETIRNIWLTKTKAVPRDNPFESYLRFQRRWRQLRKLTSDTYQSLFSDIFLRGDIRLEEERRKAEQLRAEFESEPAKAFPIDLDRIPLFEGLPAHQLETLHAICERKFFAKDEALITEGSEEHTLYIIVEGRVRISLNNHSDEAMELYEAGPGETIGEVALLIDAPHSATVVAAEPTKVIAFSRATLAALMAAHPDLAAILWHRLAQSLGSRLRSTNERYISRLREAHDVADKLLGTRPLDSFEGEQD